MRAAIDVGTNTVRLLVGEVAGSHVVPASYARRITRLGGGLIDAGLSPAAMARTLAALQEFAGIAAQQGASRVRAVGTAVLRTARNAADFLGSVAGSTGIEIEIIDGDTEARLTAAGVLSALEPRPADGLIVDIGGGSTEFSLFGAGAVLLTRSYPLGVVRLAEDFSDLSSRHAFIKRTVNDFRAELEDKGRYPLSPGCRLIGTAGTVTTLAALDLGMTAYDWRRVNNYRLEVRTIRRLRQRIDALSLAEREALPGMEKGRGDLILPGIDILLAILDQFSRETVTVSDFGLLEGILLEAGA